MSYASYRVLVVVVVVVVFFKGAYLDLGVFCNSRQQQSPIRRVSRRCLSQPIKSMPHSMEFYRGNGIRIAGTYARQTAFELYIYMLQESLLVGRR